MSDLTGNHVKCQIKWNRFSTWRCFSAEARVITRRLSGVTKHTHQKKNKTQEEEPHKQVQRNWLEANILTSELMRFRCAQISQHYVAI